MTGSVGDAERLLERLREGDRRALAELYWLHRPRLWRTVHFRLDHRLSGRVDADDVLQEAYLDAAQRLEHYLNSPTNSFFVWLRMIVNQTLIEVHRRHLGAQMRDAAREVSIHGNRTLRRLPCRWPACWLGTSRRRARRPCAEKCLPGWRRPWKA